MRTRRIGSPGSPLERSRQGRGEAGLTLVEVLVALAIATILFAALYSSFSAVTTALGRVREATTSARVARIMMTRISREVSSVVLTNSSPITGRSEGPEGEERDSMRLVTLASPDGTPLVVRYEWRGETLRRFSEYDGAPEDEEGVAISQVESLGLRYSGGDGEWSDDWSAAGPPRAVAVEMKVGGEVYGTIVPIGALGG